MEGKIFDIIEPWLAAAIAAVVAITLAFIAHRIVFALLERLTRRTEGAVDESLV